MKVIRIIAWIAVAIAGLYIISSRFTDIEHVSDGPGGPFVLTAHTGETISDRDFEGRYMLIYFGYSSCPDVCPVDLAKMTVALSTLEAEGYDTTPLQPIFISVDPERDTVEALAEFMVDYHPRMLALTGTVAEIAAVANEYKIYYRKRIVEGMDGYLVDHQNVVFVMGKDGQFERIFSSRTTPAAMVNTLRGRLSKK